MVAMTTSVMQSNGLETDPKGMCRDLTLGITYLTDPKSVYQDLTLGI